MNRALIVIDVQKYFLDDRTKLIVKDIASYIKKNSNNYSKIYFTIFRNNDKAPLWTISDWKGCKDSPDIDICDELKEFSNDKNTFYKNILSAFKVPQIEKGIKDKNITEVDLCGFETDCCVLATAYDLFDVGIKPVLLENLSWSLSRNKNLHNEAVQMIDKNIGFVEKADLS